MMETTTIEIRTDQKAQLDELKQVDSESYKSVLQRLIEDYRSLQESNEANQSGGSDSALNADDVRNACAAALRQELPDGVFR